MRNARTRIIRRILIVVIFCLITWIGGFLLYFQHRVWPNVYLGSIPLGGVRIDALPEKIDAAFLEFSKNGFTFQAVSPQGTRIVILPLFIASQKNPDLTRPFLFFDLSSTVKMVSEAGRPNGIFQKLEAPFRQLFKANASKIEPVFFLREDALEETLRHRFSDLEIPSQKASFFFKDGEIVVLPEKEGCSLDYKEAVRQFKKNIKELKNQPIKIKNIKIVPFLTEKDIESSLPLIETLIEKRPDFNIQIGENIYKVQKQELLNWIEFYKENGKVALRLNREKVLPYLTDIASEVEKKPVDARFVIENGRVKEFQKAKKGLRLDLEKAYFSLNETIFDASEKICFLNLEEVEPEHTISDINDLGIKELIARGESNFAGSPLNRIHNIKVGAKAIQGILIAPDEEFSLIKAIGEVSEKTGFLPELVIKGDRTIPEFGGGLCQLGTTAFRLALNGGFPITERVPHSYRVIYYEPAGMDATIYQPHPDLRFINDTGNFLLLQTKIEGTKLIFELYGTSDGRKVIVSDPILEDITPPGPPEYIFTDELPPGEKKKVESAHSGAKAKFTRKVIFPNGVEREEVWYSYYKPWHEVWLVGKEPEPENEKMTNE